MIDKAILDQAKQIMSNNAPLIKLLCGKQNPKDLFLQKCKELGIDPQEFLDAINKES